MYEPRAYWTWRSLVYGENYVGPGSREEESKTQQKRFENALHPFLASKKWKLLVDFGCGSGRLAPFLASHARTYLGVDISSVGIDQARLTHPSLHFLWMKDDRITLPDRTVDLVVAVTVFQHIVHESDYWIWADEIRRVLAPAGRVVVVDQLPFEEEEPHEHVRPRDPSDMAHRLGLKKKAYQKLGEHWIGVFR